jgi:Rrf2 family protein
MEPTARFVTAIQILALLAQSRTFESSDQLGAEVGGHPVVIRRVVRTLRRARLLTVQKGPGGGAKIARPAASITLRDIYRALEEQDLALKLSVFAGSQTKRVNRALLAIHERSRRSFEEALGQVTLASVLGRSRGRSHRSGKSR